MLVPGLGLLGATGALVGLEVRHAAAAERALEAVVVSGRVAVVRSALVQEVLASSVRTHLAGAGPGTALDAEVEDAVVVRLGDEELAQARRRTDAAVAAVPPGSPAADHVHDVAGDLEPLRTAVDLASSWPAVGPVFEPLTDDLLLAQRQAVDEAVAQGLEGDLVTAALETRAAADAAGLGGREALAVLDAALAPTAGDAPAGPTGGAGVTAGSTWTTLEGLAASTSPGLRLRSADLLAASRALPGAGALRSAAPADVRDAVVRATDRQDGLGGLVTAAAARAEAVTRAEAESARTRAVHLAVGALLLLLVTVAAVVRTSLALTRPLLDLADRARRVGDGELVPVRVGGPREVRTVATGLAATVASLGRLQEQARAVCAGDLGSPLLARPLPGPLGEVVHASVTGMVQAMVDRDRLREDLTHRATHDPLTELPNRARALDLLDCALARARRERTPVGVLFVDLDRFKRVNDTLGHAAGDELLRVVAARLRTSVRPGDAVCRLGGDEFLVVVERADERALLQVAERLVEAVARPVPLAAGTASVGASVGVARSGDGTVGREVLLAEADTATYRVKASGRGGVGFFDDELRAQLLAVRELEEALALGIARGELRLHYQAVVAVDDERVLGYEALVRWERPGHGLVPPADFVDVAERSALVCDLGREVLRQATSQLAAWSASDPVAAGRNVGVNISGRHLASPRVVEDVREALAGSGLGPHRLVLEITETVLVDHETALERLAELRALGVAVAIDDFGTGFTSIAQLQRMPADILKVDRSLAGSDDPADAQLVRLVVGAARAAGLEVVAEGVETSAQMDALRAAGCDAVQGFWFHRPAPPGDRAPGLGPRPAPLPALPRPVLPRPALPRPALPRPRGVPQDTHRPA
ncbi:EAL domain-containing protein [Pseudokineococcus basanitobsidens]|uniref:EAL domain-containing protein n=1 Tax=Pseudokineococcus basanitobsidens TaxID=1926649 RepID=A0ABU8RMY9_9ACTN